MVPGALKKAKAKRSCLRVHRMQMRPGEYHKVKLRTASGGSLTIRYRKTPSLNMAAGSCCSGENSSGEAEASSSASDQTSFAANNLDENQAFDNLEDLLEYSQSCVSGVAAHPCDAFYGGTDMQSDFSYYHFWSSDDCNSSDIGSNEVFPDLKAADSIGIPTANPAVINESFQLQEEQAENTSCATFEETQCYTLEQSAMLIQQVKSVGNQGIESTLFCMEACEQLAGANVWTANRAYDSSLDEGRLVQSCNLPFLRQLPPLLDETESSEVELISLPLFCYETADTICLQDGTLHERLYSHESENVAAGCPDFKEDAELFDENSFLFLDPNLPDEVNLNMNFGEPQSPWSALLESTMLEVAAEEAVQEQMTAVEKADKCSTRPRHVKEAKFADKVSVKQNYVAAWEDIPSRHKEDALLAGESLHQDSSMLSDPVATWGKKLRKKRLRRATPLNTLRSLLSSRDDFPPIQHQRQSSCSALATNFQDFCDDILCSDVTKQSHGILPAKRFTDSSLISQLESGNCTSKLDPEKGRNWRLNEPHQVYRSVHEIHSSHSDTSRIQKRTPSTSSEVEIANHASVVSSPQQSYQQSVIAPSKRNYHQGSGKNTRRSDGRGRPKYSSLLPERAVTILRKWFDDHIAFPFADKEQKLDLVIQTRLTLTQVENWLSNYRHRLKVRRSDYDGNVFRAGTALNPQLP